MDVLERLPADQRGRAPDGGGPGGDGAHVAVPEGGQGAGQEARRQLDAGVEDQHQVVRLHPDGVQGLVERPGTVVPVVDGEQDLGAGVQGDLDGGVGGVVRHDEDALRRTGLAVEGDDRVLDAGRLVVGGNDRGDHDDFSRRARRASRR